ncbi:thioredoxin family protein [Helicobacter sp. 23-1045]
MENFQNEIKDGFVIADFYAPWCGDCVRIAPILAELESEYKVIKINIDAHEALAQNFEIRRIPTLIFFKNGVEVGNRLVEPKSKKEILDEIEKLK